MESKVNQLTKAADWTVNDEIIANKLAQFVLFFFDKNVTIIAFL